MKKALFAIAVILLFAATMSEYRKVNKDPMLYPDRSRIVSIKVSGDERTHELVDPDLIDEIFEQMDSAKLSILDSVRYALRSAESINFEMVYDTGDTYWIAAVSQTGGEWYIQRPYNNIYITDAGFVDLLSKK